MNAKVTLIRHGETEWNHKGMQQGVLNSDLTDVGVRQAKATADALSRHGSFDEMYASPLGRATQTADIIADKLGMSYTKEENLKERNLGILQGLTIGEFAQSHPQEYKRFASRDPEFIIPEGESSRQRYERGNSCIGAIAARHADQNILVVTHGGIIDGVIRKIMKIALHIPRMYSLYNCGINVISISTDDWRLLSWGDIHHLFHIGSLDDQ